MEKVFESIFAHLHEEIQNRKKNGNKNPEQGLTMSGEKPFELQVDENGNAHQEVSANGYGLTVHFTALITEPINAHFDIKVTSNTGFVLERKKIPTGTPMKGELETNVFKKTTVKGSLHSSVPNTKIRGKLTYKI